MTVGATGSGPTGTVNAWSRFLGISLRPWSGTAPAAMLVRGLISTMICILFLTLAARFVGGGADAASTGTDLSFLPNWAIVVLALLALISSLRMMIGLIDLFSRHTVTGTVVSIEDRKIGDFLPKIVQEMIDEGRFRSGDHHGLDRRRCGPNSCCRPPTDRDDGQSAITDCARNCTWERP